MIKEYQRQQQLNAVLKYFISENYDITTIKMVIDAMYNILHYRNLIHQTTTPEQESLARWSLEDAKSILSARMHQLCIPEPIKKNIKMYCDII